MTFTTFHRFFDGFTEIWVDGALVAEVHPRDVNALLTCNNGLKHVAEWALAGTLPSNMRPRVAPNHGARDERSN